MAFAGGCSGTAENAVGYDSGVSAVYIHDKRWSGQDACQWGDSTGTIRKGYESERVFLAFYNADCEKICIENPTPMKLIGLPPYTQAIQPWEFGEMYTKRTCLWLKGLPPLVPFISEKPDGIKPYVNGGCKDTHGNYRRFRGRKERDPMIRSKTFPGVARAMAEQYAGSSRNLLLEETEL